MDTDYVWFQIFTLVTMKNAVFWDVVPCEFIINPNIYHKPTHFL
jgi:hypothetical protein